MKIGDRVEVIGNFNKVTGIVDEITESYTILKDCNDLFGKLESKVRVPNWSIELLEEEKENS